MIVLLTYVIYFVKRSLRVFGDFVASAYGIFNPSKQGLIPSVDNDLLLQPAVRIADRIRKGELKCEYVVKTFIERIVAVNPLVNAVVADRYVAAVVEAVELDKKIRAELSGQGRDRRFTLLPLLGIPFTCKDSIFIDGLICPVGKISRRTTVSTRDAQIIKNLRAAGAIPVAVTNTPEALMWWDASNHVTGRTNNPYDLSCIPGGSSGGEGALLASAGSVIGVGTDIGGSIRLPASFCGIFGHKATSEIIPNEGRWPVVTPEKEKYLAGGPMCRFTADLIPMLKAMAGPNIWKLPKIDDKVDMRKLRIFYMEEDNDPLKSALHPDVRQALTKAINHLETKYSVKAKKVDIDAFGQAVPLFRSCMTSIKTPSMVELLEDGEGEINLLWELAKAVVGASNHTLVAIIYALSEKLVPKFESERVQNDMKTVDTLRNEFYELLGEDGVFIYPTQPEPMIKHGTTLLRSMNPGYTIIMNILGVPTTHIPMGISKCGLPVGIQVAAKPHNDHLPLAVASELEAAFGGWVPPFQVRL